MGPRKRKNKKTNNDVDSRSTKWITPAMTLGTQILKPLAPKATMQAGASSIGYTYHAGSQSLHAPHPRQLVRGVPGHYPSQPRPSVGPSGDTAMCRGSFAARAAYQIFPEVDGENEGRVSNSLSMLSTETDAHNGLVPCSLTEGYPPLSLQPGLLGVADFKNLSLNNNNHTASSAPRRRCSR